VDDPEKRCARLALGAQIVEELFKSAMVIGTTVMMSVVNWGEVYYTLVKRNGIAKAEGVIAETLRSAPIALLSVTPDDAIRAARLKAHTTFLSPIRSRLRSPAVRMLL
jgi:hypothetical protein